MSRPGPNDTRRPDPRKDLCEELSRHLESPDVRRAAELLRQLENGGTSSASRAMPDLEPSSGALAPRPVGLWSPHQRADGSWIFERPPIGPLGDHHADRASFLRESPKGRFRVCWFGESAAAGYLLAPRYTPAKALAARLGRRYEVLDLARTNEDLAGLVPTAEASLQLGPRAWVIYTGNNWNLLETPELNPSAPSPGGLRDLARALRSGGIEGAIALARERLTHRVEPSFSWLAKRAAEHEISVVLVIPEVDRVGWDTRQPVPWLPGDQASRWHRVLGDGLEALRRNDLSAARAAAEELQALDGGRNPTSHRLLALIHGRNEESSAALRAYRRHVDEGHYTTMGCLGSPQASSFVQDLQRRLATRFGWSVVDLPRCFAEISEKGPGDDLFLDYCHLSGRGIEVAVAATVDAVRALPAAPPIPQRDVPRADSETRAISELGAAIHGAHRRLPLEAGSSHLQRWIHRAIESSPGVVDTLVDLAEARIHPAPEVLTAAQQRNLRSPYRLSLQHGWRWDHLDFDLLAAIRTVLREARSDGEELAARIEHWLIEKHAVERRSRDLSRPPYLWAPVERPFAEAMGRSEGGRRAMFRSLWPRSRFGLVSDGSGAIDLRLTVRLPEISGFERRQGILDVLVGEQTVGSVEVSESWTQGLLTVSSGSLPPGAHALTLCWPPLPAAGDEAREFALREMEGGREADLFPVFGEVFELRASASRR